MPAVKPIRVAIVGGGCASITTAFELSRPEHGGRFDVTVYQQGWRLGGKGASGRGKAGRIEEHGLHLWMGHYDNAFHLMRECYRELGRDPETCPIADWTDAFAPDPYVGIMEQGKEDDWQLQPWQRLMAQFPPVPGMPGDPHDSTLPVTVSAYLIRAARLLYSLFLAARSSRDRESSNPVGDPQTALDHNGDATLTDTLLRILKYGELATLTGIIQAVSILEMALGVFSAVPQSLVVRYLDAISHAANRLIEPMLEGDAEQRYLWEIIDIVLASLKGSVRHGLATDPRGFDAINEYDAREWLRMHGASERSVNSGFVRGLYDLAFAYQEGDPSKPAIAAGQGLRGSFRMLFTYRGSLFWKMQAGMGDIVFAPFYEVLKRRGVKFEFFHRLQNVQLSEPGNETPHVAALEFDVQAETLSGAEYQPLMDVAGLPCWPAEPDWSQLHNGDELERQGRQFEAFWDDRHQRKRNLEVSRDFDLVVLGVSLGVIPYVCRDFLERDQRWRDMVTHVQTVPTQCFQIWTRADLDELGWREPSTNISGFVEPFDTWADMTHLVHSESWPETPGSIAYFCNVLPSGRHPPQQFDRAYADEQHEIVRKNAVQFLNRDIQHLWPDAQSQSGQFCWDTLLDPDNEPSEGEARFTSQFWIANVNPTDRYVLSLPGTLQYRISPLDNSYDNLTITGDWTDCGFNFGCVEAAVLSGRLAAHALSRFPRLEDIFGYDHP